MVVFEIPQLSSYSGAHISTIDNPIVVKVFIQKKAAFRSWIVGNHEIFNLSFCGCLVPLYSARRILAAAAASAAQVRRRRCHQLSSDFGRAELTDRVANRIRKQLICRHSAGFCGMAQLHFGKERATFCSLVVDAVRLRSFQISKVKFTHFYCALGIPNR